MTSLIQNYYCTFDRTSQKYSMLFPQESDAVAIRGFTDAIQGHGFDRPTELSLHPDDFDLYHVGIFDCSTGLLTSLSEKRLVEQGKQIAIKLGLPKQLEFPVGLVSALVSAVSAAANERHISAYQESLRMNHEIQKGLDAFTEPPSGERKSGWFRKN